MEKINSILKWLDDNQNLAYSLIRFFLGTALFVRGWIFFADPGTVTEMAREESLYMWFSYVTLGHLIGGFLLMIGLLSRVAALVQIPILFGAVFIVNAGQNLASINQSLELAVMVLVLLIVYFLFGSGGFSLDQYLADKKSASKD
ncbi:MAG: DoxX family protein [Bacteroidetes bacterium]|nr:MAG: DoxX family protein [Bacteroidota bacterium]